MAYTQAQWISMQSNGADSFRSNVESNINELSQIVTLNENVVISGLDVKSTAYPNLTLSAGICVKDNEKLRLKQDIILDFSNMNDYWVNPGIVTYGYKIIALKFTYVQTWPPKHFEIKIFDKVEDIDDPSLYLFLKVVEVDFSSGTFFFGEILNYLPSDPTQKRNNVKTLIPPGGTTNQVLGKVSNNDYDFTWISGGSGGGGITTVKNNLVTINNPTTVNFENLSVEQENPTTVKVKIPNTEILTVNRLIVTELNKLPELEEEFVPDPSKLKIYRNGKLEKNDFFDPGNGAYKIESIITWYPLNSGYDLEIGMDVFVTYLISEGPGGSLKFHTEKLNVTALNTLSPLTKIPYEFKMIRLYVNGKCCTNSVIDTLNYDFETKTLITWNPIKAGYNLEIGDDVYAEYSVVNRFGINSTLNCEMLNVTGLNTLSLLTNTPIHPEAVTLFVNGKFEINNEWNLGNGSFSLTLGSKQIIWNETNAGYPLTISPEMSILAIYYY